MEFWGFIFTKEEEIRSFFHPYGYQINNDNSIKSDKVKKYCINDNWIFSSSYSYLQTINLRKYIGRSKKFAKILYSAERKILKFDYIENGKFKKQIIFERGELKSVKGFCYDYQSVPIEELFSGLVKAHFGLDPDFINPKPNHFINENKREFKIHMSDLASALFYLQGSLRLFLFPILLVLLLLVFFESLIDGTLISAPFEFYILVFSYMCFAFYLFWEIRVAFKNYYSIKNEVLKDKLTTLPNTR